MLTFPPDVVEGEFRRARGIGVAEEAGFTVVEPESSDELDATWPCSPPASAASSSSLDCGSVT